MPVDATAAALPASLITLRRLVLDHYCPSQDRRLIGRLHLLACIVGIAAGSGAQAGAAEFLPAILVKSRQLDVRASADRA